MCVLGNALADADADQRAMQGDLSRSRGQQILTAQHMGDLHQRIVDRIDQGVERLSGTTGQGEVRYRAGGERRLPTYQVTPADVLIRHPKSQHRVAASGAVFGALSIGEIAVVVVVPHFRIASGRDMAGFDLLGSRISRVRLTGVHQSCQHIAIEIAAL